MRRYEMQFLCGVEEIEAYCPGGFCPIDIGDFVDFRYKIIHKLGFGGFSTVWLARDTLTRTYVSLKIKVASEPEDSQELDILRLLQNEMATTVESKPNSHPGQAYVLSMIHTFSITSPNGVHACLVTKLGGPSIMGIADTIARDTGGGRGRLHQPLLQSLMKQTVQALDYLHTRNIVHGDLTGFNVLLQTKCLDTWSEESIYKCLGEPEKVPIVPLSDRDLASASAPKYVVVPCSMFNEKLLSEDIVLVDLGSAFLDHRPPTPENVAYTESYAAPEVLLERKAGKDADRWALGCILFEFRAGEQLFSDYMAGKDDILLAIVDALGKLPDHLWDVWDAKDTWFTSDGQRRPGQYADEEWSLKRHLEYIGNDNTGPKEYGDKYAALLAPRRAALSEDESAIMQDLLERLLDFHPPDRLPLDEVLEHTWFTM